MALLSANNIAISFGDNVIFSSVTFSVQPKDKIGLIGANGAGKTTLFKLITKEYLPDEGTISINSNCTVGYMQQHACASDDRTMYDELMTIFEPLFNIEHELEEINHTLNSVEENRQDLLERQQVLTERYSLLGGLTYKSRAKSALIGLGFSEKDFSLPCSALSGGQRSKVSLCKLLLSGAELLLLDEPTNHLDIKSVTWLEDWIKSYPGSVIVISHDRYFLDRVTNKTFELEHGKLFTTNGGYTKHIQLKEEREKTLKRDYESRTAEIKRIEGIIQQQKQFNQKRNYITIASKQKSIDRLSKELTKPPSESEGMKFKFNAGPVSGNDVLMCTNLSKSFGEKKLFDSVNLDIKRGERVFIIGENGCGKSTLLKMILGKQTRDTGRILTGTNVKIGYFDQTLAELSDNKTALDEVWDSFKKMNETEIRSAMAAFLFKGDEVFKTMNMLSGGAKVRISLLKLMLNEPNFLVLDEPTNHLDIKSREALEQALAAFEGTMLIVSHDRYLINRLATKVIRLKSHGTDECLGGYDSFMEKYPQEPYEKKTATQEKQNSYKQKKELESEIRRTKGKISRLESNIDELEQTAKNLQEEINNPENSSNYERVLELTQMLEQTLKEQQKMMDEWEELNKVLDGFENS